MDRRKLAVLLMSGGASPSVPWYLAGGVLPANCKAAYQPIGAASLAESYINVANPGTYDATEGVPPTWSTNKGWSGTAGNYLKTGITPVNNQNWTIALQLTANLTYRYYMGCNSSGGAGLSILSDSGVLYGINGGISVGVTPSPANKNYRCIMVSGNKLYLDGVDAGVTIPTAGATMQEIYLLATNLNGSAAVPITSGNVRAAGIWDVAFTTEQALAISNAMNAFGNVVVFEGDSLTLGATQIPYPTQCVDLLATYPDWSNQSASGATSAAVATQGAATDFYYKESYGKNTAVLWIGVNDLMDSVSAAAIFANIVSWCVGRKATGFDTAVLTIHPCNPVAWGAGKEIERLALNALIMAGDESITTSIDVASLPNLQDPDNTTYFLDKLHLTTAAYTDIAALVASAI